MPSTLDIGNTPRVFTHRPIGTTVGRHWTEVETPALLLELDVARMNIASMSEWAAATAINVRPHFKAHKSTRLAQLQVEAGSVGLTVATVAEAMALIDAGIDDVLVANQVVQPDHLATIAEAATQARISLFVDDPGNLNAIAVAARRAGSELGVMIDVDTGMERCGVRQHDDARELAHSAHILDNIRFDGVSAYEGHCTGIKDPAERAVCTTQAIQVMAGFVAAIRADGIDIAAISAGGTSTYAIAGADPLVTEVQPGAYALMDLTRRRLLTEFEIALSVAGTVVSRQGTRGVLDCGLKAVNSKQKMPVLADAMGVVVYVDEEHLRFDAHGSNPEIGKRIRVVPGYGPLTINLYDRFHVLSEEVVIDEWPVAARR